MNTIGAGLLSSLFAAVAAGSAALLLVSAVDRPKPNVPEHENRRRARARARSWVFRCAEATVGDLAGMISAKRPKEVVWLDRRLVAAGREDLLAAELIAIWLIEGILVGIAASLMSLAWPLSSPSAILLGLLAALLTEFGRLINTLAEAAQRGRNIRLRLPVTLEMLALLLDAGLGLRDAVETVVKEADDHPLVFELRRLLHELKSGVVRQLAFRNMASRLDLDVVNELVTALVEGETGGVPMAEGLRIQASQLRLRQNDFVKQAAGQANNLIRLPMFVMMLAALATIVGPFLMGFYTHGFYLGE